MRSSFFCQLAAILILAGCSEKVKERTADDSLQNAGSGSASSGLAIDSSTLATSRIDSTPDSSSQSLAYSHIPSNDGSDINSSAKSKNNKSSKNGMSSDAEIVKVYLAQANKKFSERDYAGCLPLYDKVLELDPSNAEAFDKRNIAKAELAKLLTPKEPQKVVNKTEDESLLDRLMHLAEEKFKNSDYKGAIKDYDYIINEKLSNTCEVYYKRGLVKSEFGKYEDAIVDFNKAIEIFPNYSDAYSHRGLTRTHMGRYKEAITDYSQVIKLHPQEKTGYFNRGIAKGLSKDYNGALIDFTKSIEMDNHYEDAYFHRAETYAGIGKFDEAITDLNKVIELNSHSKLAYYNRGQFYLEIFSYDMAIADFSKVIQMDPTDAEAYYYRGLAEMDEDLTLQACNSFTKAAELGEKRAVFLMEKTCKKKSK